MRVFFESLKKYKIIEEKEMAAKSSIVFVLIFTLIFIAKCESKKPTLLLSIISRNDEHVLSMFLGYIEKLNYPKDRISIFIQTDHNIDSTYNVLFTWSENVKILYHSIKLLHESEPFEYADTIGPNVWSENRYLKVLKLRQNALEEAKKLWANYILFIDSDNFLLNSETLNILMKEEKTIVAPMLRNFHSKSAYSNFWGGVDEKGYYRRVPEYFQILKWDKVGTFEVPMIHSTFLIDLEDHVTDKLQFYPIDKSYSSVIDDILVFKYYVKKSGLSFYICNKKLFGYMTNTCTSEMTLEEKKIDFIDSVVDYTAYNDPLSRSSNAPTYFPEPSYLGFDEIFMINLERRTDRYEKMNVSLRELGIKWRHFLAVDGKNFTKKKVDEMGVAAMSDFKDPFLKRPITFGEIGCFMSHWNIWKEIVDRNLEMVLVLEDDVRFESNFVNQLKEVLKQAQSVRNQENWDLIYTGRKRMSRSKEIFVDGTDALVHARYSYWTLGYIIRLSGAKKLLAGKPLGRMVPVDEYIPIMFDDHSNVQLKEQFTPRDLVALSAEPLLMYPTHYVGDEGYVSDTEDTLSHQEEDVQHFRKSYFKTRANAVKGADTHSNSKDEL